MKFFRYAGLSIIFLLGASLGACDSRDDSVPKPKVAADTQIQAPAPAPAPATVAEPPMKPPVAEAVSPPEPPRPPVHELSPNVPVVPVVVTKGASTTAVKAPADLQGGLSGDSKGKPKAPASDIPAAKTKSGSTLTIPRETAEKKPIPDKRQVTKNTRLNSPKLDLSLPPDLVKQMTPPSSVITPNRKPILPQMFGDKERSDAESFELNGRLLSNEMQLQMRNDNHREVEGAALDFKFKQ